MTKFIYISYHDYIMTILSHAFKGRPPTINKLVNGSYGLIISKNMFYYKNPPLEIYSRREKLFEGLKFLDVNKQNESLNEKESLELQKEFVYYVGSRNVIKSITASDVAEENVCKHSEQNKFQLSSKIRNVFHLVLSAPHSKGQFPFLNNNELKKHRRHIDIYFNFKNWLLEKFLSKQIHNTEKKNSKEEEVENWGGPELHGAITFIKGNFDDIISQHPSVLVFFSADWCQYCKKLFLPFGRAALKAKEANLSIVFATFDINSNPEIADEKGVIGVPVLKYYKNGKFVSDFKGKRTSEDLFEFAKNPPH